VSKTLFQQVSRGLRYSLCRDSGHAAVIDRAFSQETRAAFDLLPHDAGERPGGAGPNIVGCAKNRNGPNA
jgi:hypothetical protein